VLQQVSADPADRKRGAHVISFGIVDGRAIFMDERTDSYFTLDPSAQEHFHRLLAEQVQLSADPELVDAVGIFEKPATIIQATHCAAVDSLLDREAPRRPPLSRIVKAARLVRTIRRRLRAQPIAMVLADVQAIGCSADFEIEDMLAEACAFLDARRLAPFPRNCLLDSLSLLHWLGPKRSRFALIFGVKLDPFAAHCWIQADDLVINDRLESVAPFTPVRVIRCSKATQ